MVDRDQYLVDGHRAALSTPTLAATATLTMTAVRIYLTLHTTATRRWDRCIRQSRVSALEAHGHFGICTPCGGIVGAARMELLERLCVPVAPGNTCLPCTGEGFIPLVVRALPHPIGRTQDHDTICLATAYGSGYVSGPG